MTVARALPTPEQRLQDGARRLVAGDGAGAEACFRDVLRHAPDHAHAHHQLGLALRRRGRRDEALPALRRAVRLAPHDAGQRAVLAAALYEAGALDETVAVLRGLLAVEPAHVGGLFVLGTTLPQLRRTAEGIACLERAVRADPLHTLARSRLGRQLIALGDLDRATAQLRLALATRPADGIALLALATIAGECEDADERRLLEHLVRVDPTRIKAFLRLGDIAEEEGRHHDAAEHCLTALALDPGNEGILARLRPMMRRLGRSGEYQALASAAPTPYRLWLDRFARLDDTDRAAIRARIAALPRRPVFSIVMPVHNPPPAFLRAAIRSVQAQLYPDWELCIADDASTDPAVHAVLAEAAAGDPRVKIVHRPVSGHISAASNSALDLATGSHVAFLDHDDLYAEHALYLMAEEIAAHPEAMLLYSDNDKIDEGGFRFSAYFKGDWDPDLFVAQNFVCHLAVYDRAAVQAVGGLRLGFEGSQDWDLALRIAERAGPQRIRHVPHVLYHWRTIPGSTAEAVEAKPYAVQAGVAAVTDHLRRTGQAAEVRTTWCGLRVVRPLPAPAPVVSVIVPTRDRLALLRACIDGVLDGTDYPNIDLIVVDNGSVEPDTLDYLAALERSGRGRVLRAPGPFNFSALNNAAVRQARGSVLCFLNNDTAPMAPDWLREMVAQAVRPEIGAVGARLCFRDNTVQHAGVVVGVTVAAHSHYRRGRGEPGFFGRLQLVGSVSAVTAACLAVRRSVFEAVGGFDEEFPVDYNDIDLCLRIDASGLRNLITPFAELYHDESVSRGAQGISGREALLRTATTRLQEIWGERLTRDPYYNPNLSQEREFELADPPRAVPPWR
ncbi:glycosyltransferase [Azospirillum sp. sgz301742]